MAHQDDGDPKFAPLGDQVGDVVNELAEIIDEGAAAAGLTKTPLVETQRVVAGASECLANVFVTAAVFADAVNKQDNCFRSVNSPVPPELLEPIACCTEADRRCAYGKACYREALALAVLGHESPLAFSAFRAIAQACSEASRRFSHGPGVVG